MQIVKFDEGEMTFDAYAQHIHELNVKWWHDKEGNRLELNKPERFQLMLSEVAEAMEGYRKSLQDDHLPQYPMLWVELADTVIRVMDSAHAYHWPLAHNEYYWDEPWEGAEIITHKLFNISARISRLAFAEMVEKPLTVRGYIAHAIVCACHDLAVEQGCPDFWQVVYDKLVYNWSRHDHSYEAREAGGKKF